MKLDQMISRPVTVEHIEGDTVVATINHPALPPTVVAYEKNDEGISSLRINELVYDDLPEAAEGQALAICLYPRDSIAAFFGIVAYLSEFSCFGSLFPAGLDISVRKYPGEESEDRKIEVHLNSPEAVEGFCNMIGEIRDRILETESETAAAI
jgi:hypothetical protein